jgi:CheY-like chemotaxis protein
MPTGGAIVVETANVDLDGTYTRRHVQARTGPHVLLAVSDTGTGMDRETQERVFEPFFTTKEQGKGTGLGLSTVYGIVKQTGGDIWVYSEPGVGTTFKIYLPQSDTESETPVVAPAAQPDVFHHETILIVEDEPAVRALVRTTLKARGYNVIEAGNGTEALNAVAAHDGHIDLVLTDLVMPGMSGSQLAEELRILRPDSKILFMSGYTDDVAVRHGLVASTFAYLQKPFAPSVLLLKVREVMEAESV